MHLRPPPPRTAELESPAQQLLSPSNISQRSFLPEEPVHDVPRCGKICIRNKLWALRIALFFFWK